MRALLAILLACAACTDGATGAPGLDALLQVAGAQYRPGPFPQRADGPATASASLRDSRTLRGRTSELLDGVLAPEARAAIIGLAGAEGAWIVPAGPPDTDTPGNGSLHASFGLTDAVAPGPFTLLVASADATGRIGPAVEVTGVLTETRWPSGTLVVGLEWEGRADLDIHVIDPFGGEAYAGDPNTWEPPAAGEPPAPPDAYLTGGILNHDGNAKCAFDGLPNEHVAWSMPAPPGDYLVRVEVRSLCGDPVAPWYVAAYTNVTFDTDGELLAAARGTGVPLDAQGPHGKGAGTTALRFTIP